MLLSGAYATSRVAVEAFVEAPEPSSAIRGTHPRLRATGHFSSKRFYLITKGYQREVLP
jgi:hypothetical protein